MTPVDQDLQEAVAEGLAQLIAKDLESSITDIGHPVGCGIAPHPDVCLRAARRIVERIKSRALELLADRERNPS